jgi:hypothetical protein
VSGDAVRTLCGMPGLGIGWVRASLDSKGASRQLAGKSQTASGVERMSRNGRLPEWET